MMKRALACLGFALLLLSGCMMEDPEGITTLPETTAPTEPDPGIYLPESEIEKHTYGAIRAYDVSAPFGNDVLAIGNDLLLLSYGNGRTTVSRLSGENCALVRNGVIGNVRADDLSIMDNRIGYYDPQDRCAVYLDSMLQVTERIPLPEDMLAEPVFSGDLATLYYCTADEVRAFDIHTGISRLLRQQECESQYPVQVILNDKVLQLRVVDRYGNETTQFLSTENGQTLDDAQGVESLVAFQKDYFAGCWDDTIPEWVFGSGSGKQQSLQITGEFDAIVPLLRIHSAVAVRTEENEIMLELYDLKTGLKSAAVSLPECTGAYSFTADATGKYVWFMTWDAAAGKDRLCRWEYGMTPVDDSQVYTGVRYTRENPDTAGLEACREQADALSEKYGIKLLLDDQLPQPEDYAFVYEYRVPAFESALETLDTVLAQFPEGFFKALEGGKLRIGLVRRISGLTEDTVPTGNGLQYWLNGEGYIALVLGSDLERSFYHELSHVLDAHIYANSLAYDEWDKLNPVGFQYDGSYALYAQRTDNQLLEGDSRAFVDEYSKTFAKEDRARLFENAMMEGNQEVFTSQTMQSKLRQICVAIRDAYDWKKDERTFPWEQYLTQPLAYIAK